MKNIWQLLWIIGLLITLVGEIGSAMNRDRNDTISEQFWKLPRCMQFFIILAIGLVLGHWVWTPNIEDKRKDS